MVRAIPAKLTIELERTLVPLTVNVNPPLPTDIDEGVIEVIDGTGFEVTVKTTVLEVPPPGVGLRTVMFFEPVVVRSDARMVAVS